jgi:SAM-dependent methyltransferase
VNEGHLKVLSSPEWALMLETNLVPWLSGFPELHDDVLEVGPGPGLTTDLLRQLSSRVTAVELDASLATALAARLRGTNVEVIHGDATSTGLSEDRFSAASCFGMLHHVPSPELQDQVFAELHRVLRPSGLLIGTDGLDTEGTRRFHENDTFVPMDPNTLDARLGRVGFTDIWVEIADHGGFRELRFRARKPEREPG